MHYSYLWWANGFRSPMRTLCVLTDGYTAAVDSKSGLPIRFGRSLLSREEAMAPTHDVPMNAHVFSLQAALTKGESKYEITARDCAPDHARILDQGSLVQHFDRMGVCYADAAGNTAPLHGHNDFYALPDRLYCCLEFTPNCEMSGYVYTAKLAFPEAKAEIDGKQVKFCFADEIITVEVHESAEVSADGDGVLLTAKWHEIKPGNTYRISFSLGYANKPAVQVSATAIDPYQAKLVHGMGRNGVDTVSLYNHTPYYDPENHPEMCESIQLHVSNPSDKAAESVLCFAKEFGYAGVPGVVATLHHADGTPTGAYVQLSKDWHQIPNCTMPDQGCWMHLYTDIELAPHEEKDYILRLSFADYHGVYPASHWQLCLVGWGTNQLWDQCAIGCFGECITYDPDVNLGRSMVDDVRPILVYGMGKTPKVKWGWTENVGGNDFLVYYGEDNKKQYLTDVHTSYFCHGPLLTDVVYTGVTEDGAVEAEIRVQTAASTDIHRSIHSFRYVVKKEVTPKRLAFYQMGADNYNNHLFDHTAIGNENGKLSEHDGKKGGLVYHERDIELTGKAPWISFHGEKKGSYYGSALYGGDNVGSIANRGLIIRAYRAELGGKVYTVPTGAIFGTADNNCPSNDIELTLPKGITTLHVGDVITGEVEYFIPPQFADMFYGKNENVTKLLTEHPDSWEIVCREAVVNRLTCTVTKGELMRSYPVEIAVQGGAELSITNGAGLTPVSFYGAESAVGYGLYEKQGNVLRDCDEDGASHQVYADRNGKPVWTYLLNLETPNDEKAVRQFVFKKK